MNVESFLKIVVFFDENVYEEISRIESRGTLL